MVRFSVTVNRIMSNLLDIVWKTYLHSNIQIYASVNAGLAIK